MKGQETASKQRNHLSADALFKNVYREVQRGKGLELMVFMNGCYILSLDGTGYFTSKKLHSDSCMEKVNNKTRNSRIVS